MPTMRETFPKKFKKMIKFVRPKILKYSIFPEFNGTLIPFYTNKHFPKKFRLKRSLFFMGKVNIQELIMLIGNALK